MRATQKDFERIGATGCYFLSIVYIAEEVKAGSIDIYQAYLQAIKDKIINDDCFVNDPAALLRMLTGVKWAVTKENANYQKALGEKVILRFERDAKPLPFGHFVVEGEHNKVEYDPYGESLTVRSGKIVSKRVFRRV
jgi:hypothetical protein